MDISLEPGKYVVAVSGGVDSVVLLNVLSKVQSVELIVAHFDHGIRPESHKDAEFVRDLARQYALPFELGTAKLGEGASEALAREKRYEFLHEIKEEHGAKAIITAHHKDDLIETAIINLLRGTRYRGVYSMRSNGVILRPLLNRTKLELLAYAKQYKLSWREDETNADEKYLRNAIRKKLARANTDLLFQKINEIENSGTKIEALTDEIMDYVYYDNQIDRRKFIGLPYAVSCEVMANYLRDNQVYFDKKNIELAVVSAKTFMPGKVCMLPGGVKLLFSKEQIGIDLTSSV